MSGWNGISVNNIKEENDSTTTRIAACGPYNFIDYNGQVIKFNSVNYNLTVNKYYASTFNSADWINILTHELGHGLGIGIYWLPNFQNSGAVPPVDYFLNGTAYVDAQNAYNSLLSDSSLNLIALEDQGGSGTSSSHWEKDFRTYNGKSYPGFANELMIGEYRSGLNSVISKLSIRTLVGFGYEEVNPGAVEGVPELVASLVIQNNNNNYFKLNCGCNDIKNKMVHLGTLNNENN